ncbi:tetratricopeptide repeat protein [Breoghania sp.]|uniref:tetratricopeptide repeat protein n=1 Tax=Breoghania sp. TaxID=2065378 RepID=UPI002608773C|nr:tetratricopeptide repeat protein [Breoghania sp.]MDJ0933531.1 tetratricopeptide repeat protein [Breoghania sp.]
MAPTGMSARTQPQENKSESDQGDAGGVPGTKATAGEIETRRTQLLQAMLAAPDDLDIAFAYAALSARVDDHEAAIYTLERMLIYAPDLPRVQLELGVLYYRIGAFDVARQYFEAAISGPEVPREVRERVDVYLAGIDQAQDRPSSPPR